MIFTDRDQAALLLFEKLEMQNSPDTSLFYLTPDSRSMAKTLGQKLNISPQALPEILGHHHLENKNYKQVIIIDDGDITLEELEEYVNLIRKKLPKTKIFLLLAVIPDSDRDKFENLCDKLVFLHSDPLFFSASQFYEKSDPGGQHN